MCCAKTLFGIRVPLSWEEENVNSLSSIGARMLSPIADRKGKRLMGSLRRETAPAMFLLYIPCPSHVDNKSFKCMRFAASVCQ